MRSLTVIIVALTLVSCAEPSPYPAGTVCTVGGKEVVIASQKSIHGPYVRFIKTDGDLSRMVVVDVESLECE